MSGRGLTCRFAFSTLVVMAAMSGLGFRLTYLHVGVREETKASIEDNRRWTREILVRRGTITDRNGSQNILALDLGVAHVCAEPRTIVKKGKVAEVAAALASALDLPPDEIAVHINKPDAWYRRIKPFVRKDTVDRLDALDLTGVFFEPAMLRFYPHRSFMCHIIGFLNHEGDANFGVEQRMDSYLRGCPGLVESQRDAFKQELYSRRDCHIPPVAGANVRLTLDQNVQYIVEKALDRLMDEHGPRGGWAIVQEVRTGRILAMASRPAFDLNRFNKVDNEDIWRNRAISDVYEPGSTFKALTIAAALEEQSEGADDDPA